MAVIKKTYTIKDDSLTVQPNGAATITFVETRKDGDTTVAVLDIVAKLEVVSVTDVTP